MKAKEKSQEARGIKDRKIERVRERERGVNVGLLLTSMSLHPSISSGDVNNAPSFPKKTDDDDDDDRTDATREASPQRNHHLADSQPSLARSMLHSHCCNQQLPTRPVTLYPRIERVLLLAL